LREAASGWLKRRFGVEIPADFIAATTGSKEFIGTLAAMLHMIRPDRSLVAIPVPAYPTYRDGAKLAKMETVSVSYSRDGNVHFEPGVDPRDILLLWVNSPNNPSGETYELEPIYNFCRENGIVCASDECYIDFSWNGRVRSMLEYGTEGVLSIFSLSKRSNLAGLRTGFFAGDRELLSRLVSARRLLGLIPSAPAQSAAAAALSDEQHVEEQRERYRARLKRLAASFSDLMDEEVSLPAGGIYLWIRVGDSDTFAASLARQSGIIVQPGSHFGDPERIRVAVTASDSAIEDACERLSCLPWLQQTK
jgi:aspartate/methionine/tyrosine aminotransferase